LGDEWNDLDDWYHSVRCGTAAAFGGHHRVGDNAVYEALREGQFFLEQRMTEIDVDGRESTEGILSDFEVLRSCS